MTTCRVLLFAATLLLALPVPAQKKGGGGGSTPPPTFDLVAIKGDFFPGPLVKMTKTGESAAVVLNATVFDVTLPAGAYGADTALFSSRVNGSGIYTINLDGTGLTKLTSTLSEVLVKPNASPAPTLDGRHRIVFSDYSANGMDVYVMDLDGSDRRQLTYADGSDYLFPSWYPSGDAILVHKNGRLHRLDLTKNASNELVVAAETELPLDPIFDGATIGPAVVSPDGQFIAAHVLLRNMNGEDIWVFSASDTTRATNLTNAPDQSNVQPDWSADSQYVYYSCSAYRKCNIYKRDKSGQGAAIRVTASNTGYYNAAERK